MLTKQVWKHAVNEWKEITGTDFWIYNGDAKLFAKTGGTTELNENEVKKFLLSSADSQVIGMYYLFKVPDGDETAYILVFQDIGRESGLIGRMALSQMKNVMTAYEKKDTVQQFYQMMLKEQIVAPEEIRCRAEKLKLENEVMRCVFLIRTKKSLEKGHVQVIRNLFGTESCFVPMDSCLYVLIKESDDQTKESHNTACMLKDMINSEIMMDVRISYGSAAGNLKELKRAYQEAEEAMEIGTVFLNHKKIYSYDTLGLGRLIYHLPSELCRTFLEEIFRERTEKKIEDETLNTVLRFFENNLNISETARQLYIHRNTLVYRLERIEKKTGLDVRRFDDAIVFQIMLMILDCLEYRENEEQQIRKRKCI